MSSKIFLRLAIGRCSFVSVFGHGVAQDLDWASWLS